MVKRFFCSFPLRCLITRAGFPPMTTSSGHVPLTFYKKAFRDDLVKEVFLTYHRSCRNNDSFVYRKKNNFVRNEGRHTISEGTRSNYGAITPNPDLVNVYLIPKLILEKGKWYLVTNLSKKNQHLTTVISGTARKEEKIRLTVTQ